jgi:hypothetical protein
MADVSQAEFCRAVRGGSVRVGETPDVEFFVLGLSSVARAAVRRVHKDSPAAARAYFGSRVAQFLQRGGTGAATARSFGNSVDRYIQWDGTAPPAPPTRLDLGHHVTFGVGNSIRALAHVVVEDGQGQHVARLLLWDDLSLSSADAEMLALPVLECAEARLGAGSVSRVEVWQLGTNQREVVNPATARARRADVQQFLSHM